MKILYIEDNHLNRFIFKKLLEKIPDVSIIHLAETGRMGLELAENNSYDFIVIDLNLDDASMDGFDVLKTLKSGNYPLNQNTIFFALTAYYGDEWRDKCLLAGFHHYFSKPLNPTVLLKTYAELLNNRTPQD